MKANLKIQRIFYKIGSLFRTKKDNFLEFALLEETLNYKIKDYQLFRLSLTHSSTLRSKLINNNSSFTNERLEFLGDSVLNLLAAQYLYKKYPNVSEGVLTISRSKLVNKSALVKYAESIRLFRFLKTHPKFSLSNNKGMNTIIADAFEAIVGAIYLDGGLHETKIFVERFFPKSNLNSDNGDTIENYKSLLSEALQVKKWELPVYNLISTVGPEHNKTFHIEVKLNNITRGKGTGSSKKEAEQNAARMAYNWFLNLKD